MSKSFASETYVEAGVAQHVVDQRGRGGLAVAAGDADLLGPVVAARELYLRDDGDAGLQRLAHQRGGVRDAGTLDDLVGAEDFFRGVMTLLVGDAVFLQQGLAFGRDAAVVGEECVETFDFCEDGCSDSALAASECYDAFHGDYILSVIIVAIASSMLTIQKRMTILASGMALTGLVIRAGTPSFW